jgi:hypothetical protein
MLTEGMLGPSPHEIGEYLGVCPRAAKLDVSYRSWRYTEILSYFGVVYFT